MIKCQVCGYDNPDDASVCLNCGSPVEHHKISEAIDDVDGEATVLLGGPMPGGPPKPPAPQAKDEDSFHKAETGRPPAPPPPPQQPKKPATPPPPPPTARPAAPPPPPSGAHQPPSPAPQQQYGGGSPSGGYGAPAGGGYGAAASPPGDMPNGQTLLIFSIILAVFGACGGLLGIVAIIFSALGMGAEKGGDFADAKAKYGTARLMLIIGVALMVLSYVGCFGMWILGAVAGS